MRRTITLTLIALICAISVAAQNEVAYKRFVATYLPLPDRLALDTAYIGHQVRLAMHARDIMPWGATLPEREFKHFVLPPRVADETLDDSRQILQDSLASRLHSMTMEDAVLEINHWCRAHAIERPTDSRTLSPVATMATAYGNPTELNVLLVAALRSVAIPARLVSIRPRQWVEAEDGSVWTEAYIDGRWHSLEACLPEPMLDSGRHRKVAERATFIHTYVFGQYESDEEIVEKGELMTELNLTESYTTTPNHSSRIKNQKALHDANKLRTARDDKQRQSYEAAMKGSRWRGNAATIETYLSGPWDKRFTEAMLNLLTEKDLHDVSLDVLYDNIYTQTATKSLNDSQMRYVVNPRIENETLTSYKWFLRQRMAHITSIHELVAWCRDSINLVQGQNPKNLRQVPKATYLHRQADALGKKIFFVAAARSLGWAVRLRKEDGRLQWNDDNSWHEVPPLSWSEVANER